MINFLMWRGFVVGTAAVLALGTAGAVAQQAQQVAAAGSAEILIQSFQFVPATLTVAPGHGDHLGQP